MLTIKGLQCNSILWCSSFQSLFTDCGNVHDKTKISTLISVWTNPFASFIFVEGSMAKILKYARMGYFCLGFRYWEIDCT